MGSLTRLLQEWPRASAFRGEHGRRKLVELRIAWWGILVITIVTRVVITLNFLMLALLAAQALGTLSRDRRR